MGEISFRKATARDVPFLVAAVRAAERVQTGEDACTYEKLFGVTGAALDTVLARILSGEGSNHQLVLSTFFVLEQDGNPVACCSAWVEPMTGTSSAMRVASALAQSVGMPAWTAARAGLKAFSASAPRRTPGSLQMETFYVPAAARGRGLTGRIIEAVLASFRTADPAPASAEISLLAGNAPALRAYEKAGFAPAWESPAENPLFQQMTGSRGFLQLRKSL